MKIAQIRVWWIANTTWKVIISMLVVGFLIEHTISLNHENFTSFVVPTSVPVDPAPNLSVQQQWYPPK